MNKDWFNKKIKNEYIGYMKFSLILFSVICIFIGTACVCMLIFGKNATISIYVIFSSLAVIFYLFSIIYPIVSLKVIRTYPKHKRIAHLLIKKFVFVDFNPGKDIVDSLSAIKNYKLPPYMVHNNILRYIYSVEVKDYIIEHENELNLLQWGTLALQFWRGKKVGIFEQLRDIAETEYEKNLFIIALKDIRKYGYPSTRTRQFYDKNDPRCDNKPEYPFGETIIVPIVFDTGDIVVYENYIDDYYYIWKKPDESDIDDPTYLCYLINDPIRTKDDMFVKHSHLSAFSINKVADKNLPVRIVENAKGIKELIDKYGNDLLK